MVKGGRVAVLTGGTSAEREISLVSGEAVSEALKSLGYSVKAIVVDDDSLGGLTAKDADVVFVALHGGAGEDGTIQGLLEDEGLVYTGSGPEASRLAMRKPAAKKVHEENGVPTPAYGEIDALSPFEGALSLAEELGYPVVVKPNSEGSTLGITIVKRTDDLAAAVEAALAYGEGAFIEAFVAGRELTVGVLGGQALPLVEVRPEREFYDFTAKYRDGNTEYIVDVDLPRHVSEEVADIAVRAADVLGCRDMSRVDLRLSREMSPTVLEVNTIPGMTRTSLLPKAAAAAGMGFEDLVERIISMALERTGKQ